MKHTSLHISHSFAVRHWLLAVVLACWAWTGLQAQTAVVPETDWRKANEAVGQFKRGHIDVLKWEAAQAPAPEPEPAPAPAPTVRLDTVTDAVRLAWQAHPDVQAVMQRVGADVAQQVAQGQWQALDVRWQRRLHETKEWLSVAAQARGAWLDAVAARQALPYHATALQAAQTAHALGERMLAVGNWSKLQHSRTQLALIEARMTHRQAQWAVVQADAALQQVLALRGPQVLGLPSTLPSLPEQLPPQAEQAARLAAAQAQLPWLQSQQHAAAAPAWWAAYTTSHGLALDSRELLRVRQTITEETQLHYNGMLKSTWDALTEVAAQARAGADAVAAQRQFWRMEAAWQGMLQGQIPEGLPSMGTTALSASAASGGGH
jgi:hypothetical protein